MPLRSPKPTMNGYPTQSGGNRKAPPYNPFPPGNGKEMLYPPTLNFFFIVISNNFNLFLSPPMYCNAVKFGDASWLLFFFFLV
ncbi:hypothetical protein DDB_G0275915 [Dictyostelium discoideum AX4]|uniref:Uncharacterized protein n=1 Tax=Dictyostelium discoideum TaxID=44689 RepID=Q552S6_DICDI|nr:hypothetical protein DDB_G0275915 [Dictyostelium discoideum AX4]EAL69708.1 hypothetical protein DDB_G0275915 [Dictyostelium discoideum AX4]|eukprot:XP_643605.1 hypothetical protein DDB_G0275915 [Dictyostelium discoideum AX4]